MKKILSVSLIIIVLIILIFSYLFFTNRFEQFKLCKFGDVFTSSMGCVNKKIFNCKKIMDGESSMYIWVCSGQVLD